MPDLTAARFLVGATMLLIAAKMDLATRKVPNKVWLVGGAVALALFALDALEPGRVGPFEIIAALFLILASYLFWRLRLIAGGADAKAIMTLALLLPTPVTFVLLDRIWPKFPSVLPGSFVATINGFLAMMAVPLALFAWNAMRGNWRWPAMFLGTRIPLAEAGRGHHWIMERVVEGRTRLVLMPSRMERQREAENLEALRAAGVGHVWVTPKVPFMVPLAIGFVSAFFLGDVLTQIVQRMLGR